MKFVYPINIADEYSRKCVDKYKGGSNQTGFFPIGRLNNWHGGIHVEENTPIKSIANGRIIAYRLTDDYQKDKEGNEYSNNFILIQHDYESPKGLKHTFYSLYNHLLPYKYIKEEGKDFPDFLPKESYLVDGKEVFGTKEGENVRTKTGKLKGFLPNGTEVKKGEMVGSKYKITIVSAEIENVQAEYESYDPFMWKGGISEKAIVGSDQVSEDIKVVSIEIKTGQIVGFSGNYGFDRKPIYKTAHVEVFSAGDVSTFLKGKKEDVDETKIQYKIAKGTDLQKRYPGKIQQGWNIKILKKEAEFTQIEYSQLEAEVLHGDLEYKGKIDGEDYYLPRGGEKFTRLNEAFGALLTSENRIYLIEKNGDKRKVAIRNSDKNKYWIKNANLPAGENDIRKVENGDLTEIYIENPKDGEVNTVERDVLISTKYKSETIIYDGEEWILIKVSYYFNTGLTEKTGWIRKEELKDKAVSAHDWTEFGFRTLDDLDDKYVYNIDNTPTFLKNILKEIDTVENEIEADDKYMWEKADENGKLTAGELRRALKKSPIMDGLSTLVCKHTSEWDYNTKFDTLKSEIIELTDPDIIGKENEEDLKTERDKKIESIKDRVEKLSFWQDVASKISEQSNSESTSANSSASEKPPLVFPSSSSVYHFHPIAFVEHMKRVEGCFCDKDITVEAFEEIFGKGPWFTGKAHNPDADDPNPTDMANYPNVYKISTEKLVEALNNTMKKHEINSCLQKAHFLGQVGAETGFQSTREYWSGWQYDIRDHIDGHSLYQKYLNYLTKYGGDGKPFKNLDQKISNQKAKIKADYESCKADYDTYEANKNIVGFNLTPYKEKHDKYAPFLTEKTTNEVYVDNRSHYDVYERRVRQGNTSQGDGPKYKGHGLLQLTYKKNYETFKVRMGIDCVTDPEILSNDINNACEMAGVWWRKPLTGWGDINVHSENDDLLMSTLAINGGMNGLDHRYKYTQNAILSLGVKGCCKYQSMKIGEYDFDTSKIKMSKYCYKYDRKGKPIGPKSKMVIAVKKNLKEAIDKYEK